jgi:hypothetical protein
VVEVEAEEVALAAGEVDVLRHAAGEGEVDPATAALVRHRRAVAHVGARQVQLLAVRVIVLFGVELRADKVQRHLDRTVPRIAVAGQVEVDLAVRLGNLEGVGPEHRLEPLPGRLPLDGGGLRQHRVQLVVGDQAARPGPGRT